MAVKPMIEPGYLSRKPAPRSAPKRLLDQNVIPALIDAAGGVEAAIERWAIQVRHAPARSLGIALGAGALVSFLLARRQA
jgi:hypothetical protein